MSISRKIETFITRSSWIRRMFEEGARLKSLKGAENVFDFSLGNPNLSPPPAFSATLAATAQSLGGTDHGYMPNTGYPFVRAAVARQITVEQGVADLTADDLIMTCGAAGGLNIILKTLLDPDDEVIVPAPYFVEYHFYVDNHGGRLVTVPTQKDFSLDVAAIEGAITARTKAVLINSPNNPTGQVYNQDSLKALSELLTRRSQELGRTIYLIADEPYRKIVYDNITVPSVLACYPESIITTSYSKDLSIPGERIGYVAVNPAAAVRRDSNGMALANRILGFVNAPALMQRVIGQIQGAGVDIAAYARKRRLLCDGLAQAGYRFTPPAGAFYLFVQSPGPDEIPFVKALQEEAVLTVPGSGFGGPGYFRIAFCVADETIINALPVFAKVLQQHRI